MLRSCCSTPSCDAAAPRSFCPGRTRWCGPEVVALEQSILRQDPSLLVPAARLVTARCPWQGLMAYDVDDAERFFGRDADVAACLAILARSSFLALVGPSGSGKSSIMRAGVLSALRSRGHRVVLITPGSRPTQALSALPHSLPDGRTRPDRAGVGRAPARPALPARLPR